MIEIDETDKSIIDVLKENSRFSTLEISKKSGIPPATVNRRMQKLTQNGVIKKFSIVLDYEKLGLETVAYILVRTRPGADYYAIADEAAKYESVEDIASLTGQFDTLVKVRVKDNKDLSHFIFSFVRNLPSVAQTETLIVLNPERQPKKK